MPWHTIINAPAELTTLTPWKAYRDILIAWAIVVGAIVFSWYFRTWHAYAITFAVLGIQVNVLSNILHDGLHYRIHPERKINDLISQWFLSAPIIFPFASGRENHYRHHQYIATEEDLDRHWHATKGKHPAIRFLLFLIRCFLLIEILSIITKFSKKTQKTSFIKKLIPLALVQALIFVGFFFLFKNIYAYFGLFVFPILTMATFLNGFRSFCEHSDLEEDTEADKKGRLFTFTSNFLERYIVAPSNMNYHAEHHHNPLVPYYNLPSFRKHLKQHRLDTNFTYRRSYLKHAIDFFRWSHAQS